MYDKMNNQLNKSSPVLQDIMKPTLEFVKQESVAELQFFICGKKTGCNECEYLTKCETRAVSNIVYVRNGNN